MLNGTVEPLLVMNGSNSRFTSRTMTNADNHNNINDASSPKRSTMKAATSLCDTTPSIETNSSSSLNNDNRIKFTDMLVCGSCQQDFQLSDIVKFIEHKSKCGNKENKQQIPYHFPQRRKRIRDGNQLVDDDEEDYYDEEDEDLEGFNGDESNESDHDSAARQAGNHVQLANSKNNGPSKVSSNRVANTVNSPSSKPIYMNVKTGLFNMFELFR